MVFMRIPVAFFMVIGLCSCGPGTQFRALSEFRMNPKALKDGEPIKLIYADQGPGDNEEEGCFSHIIAVSQETGDTVNILTGMNNGFEETDGDKVYNFLSPENEAYKFAYNHEALSQGVAIEDIRQPKLDYQKVRYDPKFRDLVRNSYPAIIGIIGTSTR